MASKDESERCRWSHISRLFDDIVAAQNMYLVFLDLRRSSMYLYKARIQNMLLFVCFFLWATPTVSFLNYSFFFMLIRQRFWFLFVYYGVTCMIYKLICD